MLATVSVKLYELTSEQQILQLFFLYTFKMPLAPPKGLKQMQKSFIMIQVETLHARNAKNAKILHHGLVVTLHARYVSTLHIKMTIDQYQYQGICRINQTHALHMESVFCYHAYRPARESAFISFHDMFLFNSKKSLSVS